jgi:hypothetical protein
MSDLGYKWLLYFTAKAIAKQSEKEVSVKKDMAFPLALVCVLIYQKHAPFLDILLAKLTKKCPYLCGVYIKRMPVRICDTHGLGAR